MILSRDRGPNTTILFITEVAKYFFLEFFTRKREGVENLF